jgi:hypothetical protein
VTVDFTNAPSADSLIEVIAVERLARSSANSSSSTTFVKAVSLSSPSFSVAVCRWLRIARRALNAVDRGVSILIELSIFSKLGYRGKKDRNDFEKILIDKKIEY